MRYEEDFKNICKCFEELKMVLIIIGVLEVRGIEDKMIVSRWDMGSLKKKKIWWKEDFVWRREENFLLLKKRKREIYFR